MSGDYLAVARRLPRPTAEQCEAFARGMSGKHSWYKHVPITPAVPFLFLVAPLAPETSEYGSRMMDPRTVHVRSAPDHERSFGFWECLAPYEMGSGLSPEHRARVAAARGIWIYTGAGETGRVDVPDPILEAGVVHVNAFVDPRAPRMSPYIWLQNDDRYGVRSYLRGLGIEPPDDPSELREVWLETITVEHRTEARARMLAAMVEAMSRVTAAIWGAPP